MPGIILHGPPFFQNNYVMYLDFTYRFYVNIALPFKIVQFPVHIRLREFSKTAHQFIID